MAFGCGSPSRNTKGQGWGGWRGIFLPERPGRIMSALVEWGRRKAALSGSTQLGDSGTGTGPWASFLPQSPCSRGRGWKTCGPPPCLSSLSP